MIKTGLKSRLLTAIIALTMILGISTKPIEVMANTEIKVFVDGVQIQFDQPPVMIENRVMVPIRHIAESLGYSVELLFDGGAVELRKNADIWATIWFEMDFANYNTEQNLTRQNLDLSPSPRIINGRTVVGIRDMATILGADVNWNGDTRTVTVVSGNATNTQTTTQPAPNPPTTTTPTTADAPTPAQTRSSVTMTNERMTETQLNAWIAEYKELGGANDFELEVVRLINIERAKENLEPLTMSKPLMMAARFKSQEMVDLDYFSHTSPIYSGFGGGSSTTISEVFGYRNIADNIHGVGENLSSGRPTPEIVVEMWLDSPGHRRPIMSETNISIGIGRVGTMTTANFGS